MGKNLNCLSPQLLLLTKWIKLIVHSSRYVYPVYITHAVIIWIHRSVPPCTCSIIIWIHRSVPPCTCSILSLSFGGLLQPCVASAYSFSSARRLVLYTSCTRTKNNKQHGAPPLQRSIHLLATLCPQLHLSRLCCQHSSPPSLLAPSSHHPPPSLTPTQPNKVDCPPNLFAAYSTSESTLFRSWFLSRLRCRDYRKSGVLAGVVVYCPLRCKVFQGIL